MPSARETTDKMLEQMEKHLTGIYSRAQKEVGEAWFNYLDNVEDELSRLREEYEAVKRTGDKAAIKKAGRKLSAKTKEKTIYNQHYQRLTKQVAEQLAHVNETAMAYVNGKLPRIYSVNYNEVAEGVSAGIKGISFDLMDASTVKRLATEQENLLPYKYVDGEKTVRWNVNKINSEVLQGIIQGESIPHIADRMENVLEMNRTSAIRNARTTVTSAENKGRMDMLHDAEEKGVIAHKIWLATSDNVTRDWHAELDGDEKEIDEPFEAEIPTKNGTFKDLIMYPGDPSADPANVYNCRCTMKYKVVGFVNPKTGETNYVDEKQEDKQHNVTVTSGIFDEATTKNVNTELSKMSSQDAEKWKKQIESATYKIDPDGGAYFDKNTGVITIQPNEEGWAIVHENAHRFDYTSEKNYIARYTDRKGRTYEDDYGPTNPHWFLNYGLESEKLEKDWSALVKEIGLSTTSDGYLDTDKVFEQYNTWAKNVKSRLGLNNNDDGFGALSDIISSITLDGCGESLIHGGHSQGYWNNTEMIYAENWADFCYLKATQRQDMLDILAKIAPNRHDALQEVYDLFWTTSQ